MTSSSSARSDYPGATIGQWWQGARPHTWANAFAPVLAGTAAAVQTGQADALRAVLAAAVALSFIIGVNYANDYSDGIRGTDDERSGPLRLTGSGLVKPQRVKLAAFIAFGAGAIAGIALCLLSARWLIPVGAVCIAAAWFYTGGKNPYGYRGLGEVAVFVFFGLVAVLGTEFTQSGRITWQGVLCAITIGALSASVNLANNLRDIPTDTAAGKITLAVRLGDGRTRMLWFILASTVFYTTPALAFTSPWVLLGLLALPLLFIASRPVIAGTQGRALIPVLGLTGRAMLLWALAVLAGYLIPALA